MEHAKQETVVIVVDESAAAAAVAEVCMPAPVENVFTLMLLRNGASKCLR
jgi:hypothetical protein